jgi:hypothetical protein
MADFEEMRKAVTRAMMQNAQIHDRLVARIANEEEVERLRLENLELRSEIQRLTQQAHYAG